MDPDDGMEGMEEEGPYLPWLPPDDRLWRHPSEGSTTGTPGDQRANDDRHERAGGQRWSRSWLLGAWGQHPAARIWTVAVVAGVIGAVAASGFGIVSGAFEQQTTVVHSVVPTAPTDSLASATTTGVDWTSVDSAIAPSVVQVAVSTLSGPTTGSGLLLEPGNGQAYVITDSSLLAGEQSIEIVYVSGDQQRGHLVGSDPESGLALIAVAAPTSDQSYPQLGTVADVQLANPVMAVGSRSGGAASVFPGSVTGEDREVDLAGGSSMENLIAVSASPPLPANAAGGPLVDQLGQVVGITVSLSPTSSTDQSLVFAVPVDVALHVAQQLMAGSEVTHPWLGVTDANDLTFSDAQQYGLTGGARVGQVSPGSPANRVGLRPNDIITSVNGTPVTSSGMLTQILFTQAEPGRWLSISYVHKGKPLQASVYVANQPDND